VPISAGGCGIKAASRGRSLARGAKTEEHSQQVANLVSPGSAEPEYPIQAVHEAVLNALIHRDYRLSGRASVRIYDDRLEVWNPGGMPVQLSLEHLAQHGGVSFPRNPVLASAARVLGLMDQIGRGLPTIRRAVSQVTSLPAHFGSSQSDFLVVVPSRFSRVSADEGATEATPALAETSGTCPEVLQ
jgi:predicted HTH transcriptional regulator